MAKKDWKPIVKATLENYPDTRENNQALWIRITNQICLEKGWNTKDEIFYHTLKENLPSHHSLVAAASIVKRENPELMPTKALGRKMEIQTEYINEWYNYINN